MKRFIRAVVLLGCAVSVAAFAACRSGSGNEKRYEVQGKVGSVDRRGSTVTLAHEEIPGYMDAMTMPFTLKDRWAFDVIEPGNNLHGVLVVDEGRSWLEEVVITQQSADEAGATKATSAEPQPGAEVPDFSLVNQDAKRIRLHQYKGRALVLTFIYTRCPLPDYCPLMTERFTEIATKLKEQPALAGKSHLLSISVDPEFDTPEVMRGYGKATLNGEDKDGFERWEFATGSAEEIRKIATFFGMQYWPEGDQIIHTLRTAVIGPDGKLVKLYTGNEWRAEEVLGDLKGLGLN